MRSIFKVISVVTIFSIAMGFMETAVVIYIRELYYPAGFNFPIVPVSRLVLATELFRELATIIMLISIGFISGRKFKERFAIFLLSFAVWDLAYYLFLKLLINWPASLLTWDLLFLIPIPWAGPVLAPCIISLNMIFLAFIIICLQEKNYEVNIRWIDWMFMLLYSLLIIFSFTIGYLNIILTTGESITGLLVSEKVMQFVPFYYNWYIFSAAQFILMADYYMIIKRSRRKPIAG